MKQRDFINFLDKLEKLKCTTRHSWTSTGRHESVAEHSWRLAVMAMLCGDEYPGLDIDRVIKMCLIHDIGESVTGDIPSFKKTDMDDESEDKVFYRLISELPEPYLSEFRSLYGEFREQKTDESRLCRALDNLEAVLEHNEAPIETWLPLEYELQLRYGEDTASFSEWTSGLKEELNKDTINKINKNKSGEDHEG